MLDLFQLMMDVPEGERIAWIESNSAIDSPLRNRLLALLAGDRLANLRTGGASDMLSDEPLPDRIGAYRITGLIGQGGMGAVYRGERMTGDFDHVAAIKLIRPGALSNALVERFQRERQTLASLSHPNIARLFDGGTTDNGDPYIVMEYVDGVALGSWITHQAASKAQRTQLFLDMCGAVGFAHQNLIIHRDITPSNILVAKDGTAKLIDFGIARPQLADAEPAPSGRKSLAGLSLTPGYAAPERIAGAAATTLSDVYSLGILLDRIFDGAKDTDLQAIIDLASADAPADRYPSVDALAEDIKAWRDGQAVAARKGGKRYVLGKFIARNKAAVAAAAAAVLLLVGGLAATLYSYFAAEKARAAEAQRFGEVRRLANYMLFDLNPRLEKVVGNAAARIDLAARAQSYLSALNRSQPTDPGLRRETARGLVALAYIQGVPGSTNLGQFDAARSNVAAAIALISDGKTKTIAPAELADALVARSMIEAHTDIVIPKAKTSQAEAVTLLEAVAITERDERWRRARSKLRIAELEVATLEQDAGRLRSLADAVDQDIASWPQAEQRSRDAKFDRAVTDYYRAIAGYASDELAEGLKAAQRAEKRLSALDAQEPNDPAVLYTLGWTSYVGYGVASGLDGEAAETQRFLALADSTNQRLLAVEPHDQSLVGFAATVRQARAEALQDSGRVSEAIGLQRQVIALLAQSITPQVITNRRNRIAIAQIMLSRMAVQAGDMATACKVRAEALRTAKVLTSTGKTTARLTKEVEVEEKKRLSC